MSAEAEKPAAQRRRAGLEEGISYAVIAGAVLLAWQIVIQPVIQRGPVSAAIRVAPSSPVALGRAAEAELAAGRHENAGVLSREALARSPFDVRALRVAGLARAREGLEAQADEILTLAGNWSLRDDPAHAWLVARRLRRGDYSSAFAHADTLVRRRPDMRPQIFRLFTTAGVHDPQRSLPVTASLLAADPPWREAYFNSLDDSTEGLQVAANLAVLLQKSASPLSDAELQRVYRALLTGRQVEALRTVRTRLDRPSTSAEVTNGGFADSTAPEPFQWRLAQSAGVSVEIVGDDVKPDDLALRLDYNGYSSAIVAEQLVLLPAGQYRFSALTKVESGDPAGHLVWTVTCLSDPQAIMTLPSVGGAAAGGAWTGISKVFDVRAGCPAQWLRLEARGGVRRSSTAVWFDQVRITPRG